MKTLITLLATSLISLGATTLPSVPVMSPVVVPVKVEWDSKIIAEKLVRTDLHQKNSSGTFVWMAQSPTNTVTLQLTPGTYHIKASSMNMGVDPKDATKPIERWGPFSEVLTFTVESPPVVPPPVDPPPATPTPMIPHRFMVTRMRSIDNVRWEIVSTDIFDMQVPKDGKMFWRDEIKELPLPAE